MLNTHTNNLIKLIQKLSYRHQTWQVFSDFLELFALAVSNSMDWRQAEEREKQYLETINRYEKKEQELFPELCGELVLALEDLAASGGPGDVLGQVFHELELHNRYKGQFFTPDHICEMMGEIAIGNHEPIIEEKGYITVSEPCSGSGAMILGLAKALKKRGYNYCSQMVVTAVDIDLKCVYMTYLQLSLYGIPGVVIHGDTLLAKEYSRWYTPIYLLHGWRWRQECGIVERSRQDKSIETKTPVIELPRPVTAAKAEQISLVLGKVS